MIIKKTKFKDLIIFGSKIHQDSRGNFREIFKKKYFNKNKFVFTCASKSKGKVLRGLHFQSKFSQGKYLMVLKGRIFDIALDLRKNSKTFGKHYKVLLSEKNCKSIYIPEGFAHGFSCLGNENIVIYSCTNYRNASGERGILWNDKTLKINWRVKKPIVSKKDKNNPKFKDIF